MCNDKAICSNYHAACSVYCGPAEEFLLGQEGQQLFSKTFLLHLITVQTLEFNEFLKQNLCHYLLLKVILLRILCFWYYSEY